MVYSASVRDAKELARRGIAEPDPCVRLVELREGITEAGFEVVSVEPVETRQLRDLGTTWAKRLWRDPERRAWRIVARCQS